MHDKEVPEVQQYYEQNPLTISYQRIYKPLAAIYVGVNIF
jgi:hypothetical protein